MCKFKNIDECNGCEICIRLELKYPLVDEVDIEENPFMDIVSELVEESIMLDIEKIFDINREELNKFIKGEYSSKMNNKIIKLNKSNKIHIEMGFQDEIGYDGFIGNMGLMNINMPEFDYENMAIFCPNELINLIHVLKLHGFRRDINDEFTK